MSSATDLLTRALQAIEEGRLASARALYLDGKRQYPERRALFDYNLGAWCRSCAGDGKQAREQFEAVWGGAAPGAGKDPRLAEEERKARAMAAENMLFLSLSFDEYFAWAERLRALAPDEPVFQQVSEIESLRPRGRLWPDIFIATALDQLRAKLHGNAASMFQLLMPGQGPKVRLKPEERSAVISGYAGAMMMIGLEARARMQRSTGRAEPGEFLSILETAHDAVGEYVATSAADPMARESLAQLRQLLEVSRAAAATPPAPQAAAPETAWVPCPYCGAVIAVERSQHMAPCPACRKIVHVGFILFLRWLLSTRCGKLSVPLGALAGSLLGLAFALFKPDAAPLAAVIAASAAGGAILLPLVLHELLA